MGLFCGHFDLLLKVITQLVDIAGHWGGGGRGKGKKRGTTCSGAKGYWIMNECVYTYVEKEIFFASFYSSSHISHSWPSFTKSSVYKSLFLSELCWKPAIVFDTCPILGAGCILSGFGSYYYTSIPVYNVIL